MKHHPWWITQLLYVIFLAVQSPHLLSFWCVWILSCLLLISWSLLFIIFYCYRNQLVGSGVEGLEAIGSPLPLRKRKSGITEVVHTKRRNSDSQHEATVGCNTVSPNSASSAGSTTKRRRVTSNSSNSEARDAVSVKKCDTKVGKDFQSYKDLTL